jgi:hypothetical protein
MKLHVPEAFEAHHVLQPQQRRAHGLEVGRDVIDMREAETVGSRGGGRRELMARKKSRIALALHEAKCGVSEGRGDREGLVEARALAIRLNVADRISSAAVELGEGGLDVLHLEG